MSITLEYCSGRKCFYRCGVFKRNMYSSYSPSKSILFDDNFKYSYFREKDTSRVFNKGRVGSIIFLICPWANF